MAYIEFRNVKKIYKTGSVNVTALDGCDFFVEQGELCVILGQDPVADHALITLLIMHCSGGYHALIMWLIMH